MFEHQAQCELRRILEGEGALVNRARRCLSIARKAEAAARQLTDVAFRFYGRGQSALSRKYAKSAANLLDLAAEARGHARRFLKTQKMKTGFGYLPRKTAYPKWGSASESRPWRPKETGW